MEPERKKQCIDLRGEESDDDSSVEFTGFAPAPSKSMKTMKEVIRAAGLGVADLVERSDVEARYEQALARLEEADRRKAPSAASATSSNYAWRVLPTRAIGGADSPGNRGALSLADVMAGSPLWALGGNFQINGHTFKKYCSPLLSVERLIIFHGCARSARDLRSCAPNATIYDMTPKKLTFVNPRTGKEWQNTYGCHHSKYFIIGSKDSLRVAIGTFNLISCDINNKTQGIWSQDFPIKTAGAPLTSDFEEQLVKYFLSLQKHAARMPMSWRGLGDAFGDDEQLTIAQALRKFDFSGAKARLVASTPGYHSGADLHSFGANRVAALLANEGDAAAQKPDDQIPIQFSSLSSPTNPLATLKAAFHAPKRLCPSPPKVDLSIVWPTAAEVCASVEGYGAGGALPSAQKNVDKVPREMFCRWTKDESSDFVTARRRAMPHIKTWTRVSGDGSTVRWSILTSANLSGGAWGNVRDGGRTLHIMHWELGVLVTPSILGAPLRTTQGSEGAIVPLPFPCPPRPYAQGDVPFSWEARYETPDRWGKHGTR
jgi:tyrosyl-DNA phosphodiesterase-1